MSEDSVHTDPGPRQTPLEEDLVAYLDGELDSHASRRVEELLSADPKVRAQLQGLERTWRLLDRLDRPQPDDQFTRTTLEMVAIAAEEDLQEQQAKIPRERRRRWLIGSGGLLAAAVAGFLAVVLLRPSPNQQFLEDLSLLENLDLYRQVENIEFLRLLEGEKLMANVTSPSVAPRAEETLAECRARMEKMSPAEKEQLLRRHERLASLDPAEQRRLRQLDEDLEQAGDAPQLRQTMQRYHEWVKTLALYQRMELTGLPPEKRVERVKRLVQEQAKRPPKRPPAKEPPRVDAIKKLLQRQARELGQQLEPQDVEGLFAWSAQMVDRYGAQLLEKLPKSRREEVQGQLDSVREPKRRRQLFGFLWMQWQAANEGKLPPMTDKDLAELRAQLSKSTRERLQAKPSDEQWKTVFNWIGLLFQQERSLAQRRDELISPETEEELALFFEHVLSEEEKDRLSSMPPDQMLRELWREYARSKLSRAPARSGEPGAAKRGAGPGPRPKPWRTGPSPPAAGPQKTPSPPPESPAGKPADKSPAQD